MFNIYSFNSNFLKAFTNLRKSKLILTSIFKKKQIYEDIYHLNYALDWLCRAQDITNTGGVSSAYSINKGWLPPYPETTGYIISTFLRVFNIMRKMEYLDRAIIMGDWERKVQLASGGIVGGLGFNRVPIVFNTGQVILGWLLLFENTKNVRFLKAAEKAAKWLIEVQDNDGKWSKFTYMNTPHSYHTRVSWALFKIYEHTDKAKFKDNAMKNVIWTLKNHNRFGWFERMGFKEDEIPYTHTIAYTLRGLLEISCYCSGSLQKRILNIIETAIINIIMNFGLDKKKKFPKRIYLPARLNCYWRTNENYSCLTGNAQLAIIMLKLYEINKNLLFLNSAINLIDEIKLIQSTSCKNEGIRGAIPGSYPIWGNYQPFKYPNWATKFFCDALLYKLGLSK